MAVLIFQTISSWEMHRNLNFPTNGVLGMKINFAGKLEKRVGFRPRFLWLFMFVFFGVCFIIFFT